MTFEQTRNPKIIYWLSNSNDMFLPLTIINNLNIKYKIMEPKIKMSKHINSKLPDVFIQSRNIPKDRGDKKRDENKQKDRDRPQRIVQKQKNQQQKLVQARQNRDERKDRDRNKESKKQNPAKKKSRNPFLNVRQYLKLSKQMDQRMRQVRQQLQLDRFSQLNFQNNPDVVAVNNNKEQIKEHKIKYEDCLTLNLLKKTQTSSLKKILHVPSLTVYYLRQSLIDFSIDKNDLQQWIRKCNSKQDSASTIKSQKIVQLYWNIPETYYSIIYEYADGVLFDTMIQSTAIFPTHFIQSMALTHLKADFQIFNSILIIKRNIQSQICFLPVYEETDDIIPQYRTFRELLKINNSQQQHQDFKKIEKMLVAKLGFLVLVTFFSQAIVDQDIANILFQSKDCCLFHKQINTPNSLIKIFFDNNVISSSQKQIISDFFCKILKFRPEQRATFAELSKHKFLKTKLGPQICRMQEVIHMLQSTGSGSSSVSKSPSKQLSMHKLNKILSNMALILQGSSQKQKKQINLSSSNENIKYILYDLGLGNSQLQLKAYANQIINKLRRMYDV